MEKNINDLAFALAECKNEDEEYELCKRMVKLLEPGICWLEENKDKIELPTGECFPHVWDYLEISELYLIELLQIHINRKEYAKALPLIEKALSMSRILVLLDSQSHNFQECIIKLMIECLRGLEKKELAIVYSYELKLLKNNIRRMDNSSKK